jgi:hypothetical protein
MIRKTLSLIVGLSLVVPAFAAVYTWTDEQGKVHYSDKPVAGAHSLDIVSRRTDPALVEAERQKLEAAQAAEAEAAQNAAEEHQLSAVDEAKREENCLKARARLSAIMGAQRPYRALPDGERHYLTDEEIDKEIAEAEAGVSEWCAT